MTDYINGLSPCPFCGSTLLSFELHTPAWGGKQPQEIIVCDNCCSTAPVYIWNKRNSNACLNSNKQTGA